MVDYLKSYSCLGGGRSYGSRFLPEVNNFQVELSHILSSGPECYVLEAGLAIWAGLVNTELFCKLSSKNDHSYSKHGPMITPLFPSPWEVESCIPWGWDLQEVNVEGEAITIRNLGGYQGMAWLVDLIMVWGVWRIRGQYVSHSVQAGTRDPSEERALDAQFVQGLS